jgi:putative FmdB family regulatory protein
MTSKYYYMTVDGNKCGPWDSRSALDEALHAAGLREGKHYTVLQESGQASWRTADFDCMSCGHEFEELYRPSKDLEISCPKCGGTDTPVKLAAPALAVASVADGSKREESMELTVRRLAVEAAGQRLPVAKRGDHLKEAYTLGEKAAQAKQRGQ